MLLPKVQNAIIRRGGEFVRGLFRTKSSHLPKNTKLSYVSNALEEDVVEISNRVRPTYSRMYVCSSHKTTGDMCCTPDLLPKYYLRNLTDTTVAEYAPNYKLENLWAKEKGDGTRGVQSVVLESLTDKETLGRVTLDASCRDGFTSPGAFYYKLGFRFVNPMDNKKCAKWLKSSGRYEDSPFVTGFMYLPKENIEHCLKYGDKEYYTQFILPQYGERIKQALSQ